MMTPDPCDVLVVGAGPTGLTLAATLAKLGVHARIIDKNAAPSDKSKALGVQAGSLEALGQFFGSELSDRMVAAGHKAQDAFYHFSQREPVHLDLRLIPSRYDYVLILPQSQTERFLAAELAAHSLTVERRSELVAVSQNSEGIVARLRGPDGNPEEVRARFVVGCDGAHSIVRREASIGFAGGSYRGDFILGDVVLQWPWAADAVRLFVSERGFLGAFPLPGPPGSYRLIMVSQADQSALTPEISTDEFSAIVDGRAPQPIDIQKYLWLTRFNLHHRMAEHFRSGRMFLAGDAAHIHSPVGGQGMNTGIQDALNLGSKLAAVLRRGKSPEILDRYEAERLPVARNVLRRTDRAFRSMMALNTGRWRYVRLWLAPRVIGLRPLQKRLARLMSQVDVARKEMREREQELS